MVFAARAMSWPLSGHLRPPKVATPLVGTKCWLPRYTVESPHIYLKPLNKTELRTSADSQHSTSMPVFIIIFKLNKNSRASGHPASPNVVFWCIFHIIRIILRIYISYFDHLWSSLIIVYPCSLSIEQRDPDQLMAVEDGFFSLLCNLHGIHDLTNRWWFQMKW